MGAFSRPDFPRVGATSLLLLLTLGLLATPGHLRAQSEQGQANRAAPANNAADAEWATLESLGRDRIFVRPADSNPASIQQAKDRAVAALVSEADRLHDFYTAHPEHPAAREARRREALTLLQAVPLGGNAQEARRRQLVAEIRRDTSLLLAQRAEVAALADNFDVQVRRHLSRDDRLFAYEQVARGLNSEFPGLPDGYASLVQIAKESPDVRSLAIAREVAGQPVAPPEIRAEARILVERHGLVGRPLHRLAERAAHPGSALRRQDGRPTIIYTWTSQSRPSLALASRIAALAPPAVSVVGVCLDQRDLGPAKLTAAREKLPGEQVYDWMGRRGELAEALKFTDPGLVYLADRKGVIRVISAQRDLPAALAAVLQP